MMRTNRELLKHILINISVTSFFLLFILRILPIILLRFFSEKIVSYIGGSFLIPAGLIILLFKRILEGNWGGMHNVSFRTYIVVSFVFYSLLIALIQFLIYKRGKRNKRGQVNHDNVKG
jgi:hypothetical protein